MRRRSFPNCAACLPSRGLLVPPLEGEQPILEFGQGREVVRRHDLALDDRELRWRQGCKASALSHRQIVTPLICATMPRLSTSRCSSGIVKRASGTSTRLGSSQASRLTSTTTLEGKAGCAPASRLFLKAWEALFEEPVAPLADDLARRIESGSDEIVAEPLGGQQHDLRADNVSIR